MTEAPAPWDSRIGRRLKLRDLRILFAVVEAGSMAKAAGQLRMSQPAISEAIANLEGALDVRLLDRSRRGVEPTIYAQALLKRGRNAFAELDHGMREIGYLAHPTAGVVRIGCPENMMSGFVPAIIDRLSRRYPQIVVHAITAQPGAQQFQVLRESHVDLMLGRILRPVTDAAIASEIIGEDRFFVVAGASSPWIRRRQVALAELVNERWILFPPDNVVSSSFADVFQAHGLEAPQASVISFSLDVRMHLLATGRFLTVLSGLVLQYNAKRWSLRALPVDFGEPVPITIFTLKDRTTSPVAQLFIEQAGAVAASLQKVR
ncbi:MAG TPA: LysR family transcriptional regulator [Xanthobacteraceae bacterium]|nr:LysR family transcriptional regulator [Xanthobacteraceae bacterium]